LDNSLFRVLLYLFVSILSPNLLFPQHLIYENGSPSHPQVLGYGSPTRSIIDLAGEWEYSLDNGIIWSKINVPSAVDAEGKIIYRKKFVVDAETINNSAFMFVSYGINYSCEVYINETFVGKHEGGYTSFALAVPDNVIQLGAENVIRIVVDNRLNYQSTFPVRAQVGGKKNYNGIVRDIFIAATPLVWIDYADVVVEAIDPKAARMLVSASLSAKDMRLLPQLNSKTFQLSVDVVETNSGVTIGKPIVVSVVPESNKDVTSQISVAIPNVKLWSPESPELYTVNISLLAVEGKKDSLIDQASLTTGIRTFTKDQTTLLFNGVPVTLRGVVWIEDSENHGCSLTYEEMEKDVALIKNLGANTVRVAFNPPHPFFIQLCDRYGLFVLQDIPNNGIPGTVAHDEKYRTLMGRYLQETIKRDKHHPSIIAWGLGEVVDDMSNGQTSTSAYLNRTAKSLDDRLTYALMRSHQTDENLMADIAALDVGSAESNIVRRTMTAFKQSYPKHPLLIAAYGNIAEKGNRNGYSDPNSQEAQARFIQRRYSTIKEAGIAGSLVFSFNDFRSDRPMLSTKPADIPLHTAGIVELGREKKVSYDMLHSLYHDQKVSALPLGSFTPASPYEFVVVGLGLLIVVAWLVNRNRRYRESIWRAMFKSYNFFADIRDQFTIPLFHTTLTAVIISVTFSVILSSILHHYRSSTVLDYALSLLLSDDIKRVVIQMAWNPLRSIGYLASAMFLWLFAVAVLIQFFSIVVRVKIRFFHSYSIAVWTSLPWIFFIPVGMILYRVLVSEPYVPWVLGCVGVVSVWVYIRALKGMSVIYHIYTPKMYMVGILLLLVSAGGVYASLDYFYAFSSYAEYFISHVLPSVN
jgi:hypothetical protein